jgi:hypothetical protein
MSSYFSKQHTAFTQQVSTSSRLHIARPFCCTKMIFVCLFKTLSIPVWHRRQPRYSILVFVKLLLSLNYPDSLIQLNMVRRRSSSLTSNSRHCTANTAVKSSASHTTAMQPFSMILVNDFLIAKSTSHVTAGYAFQRCCMVLFVACGWEPSVRRVLQGLTSPYY